MNNKDTATALTLFGYSQMIGVKLELFVSEKTERPNLVVATDTVNGVEKVEILASTFEKSEDNEPPFIESLEGLYESVFPGFIPSASMVQRMSDAIKASQE